jgi:hypothetical protein
LARDIDVFAYPAIITVPPVLQGGGTCSKLFVSLLSPKPMRSIRRPIVISVDAYSKAKKLKCPNTNGIDPKPMTRIPAKTNRVDHLIAADSP